MRSWASSLSKRSLPQQLDRHSDMIMSVAIVTMEVVLPCSTQFEVLPVISRKPCKLTLLAWGQEKYGIRFKVDCKVVPKAR